MKHDEFVGQVQHRAELPSRGDAEMIIRATFETLGERLLPRAGHTSRRSFRLSSAGICAARSTSST